MDLCSAVICISHYFKNQLYLGFALLTPEPLLRSVIHLRNIGTLVVWYRYRQPDVFLIDCWHLAASDMSAECFSNQPLVV